ncbi:TM2 domain-containing protein [Methanosarcina lacustris]|uniref:TM2 domain-containing protein n=1 Tax=Methanosarcina lacustris TaxID=170861 RepID=UPI00064F11B8|nr:zinc-ribbon domain and TM2 domain-containing protein [Methanosarcina lacustris]
MTESKFCRECGAEIKENAEICPKCGVRQKMISSKNKTVAGLLALFLGGIGIHKFYMNKPLWGLIYILFCWTFIPSIAALIEGLMYLFESEEKFQGRLNPN